MKLHTYDNYDPRTARMSSKFLVMSADGTPENARLIVFSSIFHQHIDVRADIESVLGEDCIDKLFTAGVFTRKVESGPFTAQIGSESLNKAGVEYDRVIEDSVKKDIENTLNNFLENNS